MRKEGEAARAEAVDGSLAHEITVLRVPSRHTCGVPVPTPNCAAWDDG
ncbi:hypothetical protein ABZ883_13700 [Streptomyces sp. NPDC046977]